MTSLDAEPSDQMAMSTRSSASRAATAAKRRTSAGFERSVSYYRSGQMMMPSQAPLTSVHALRSFKKALFHRSLPQYIFINIFNTRQILQFLQCLEGLINSEASW
jgi:hypothetical protein